MDGAFDPNADRKAWLSVLARADSAMVQALWDGTGLAPTHDILRAPEIGAVMVRGRAGAVGAPFNLGEMTFTRASVRLESGLVGHGFVQGRCKDHARIAALVDALMQTDQAAQIEAAVIAHLRKAATARAGARAARAAATKVDFFTVARGED
ncbi:phosphonate C-P lyase system protein PhnG [uncultured Tateyamaria sp.]|uniref:phosphonate C-P lyase system protein PhnG n=1 Tax=uncultured Tateyamaria sp. TaxID=455651 RepID=UPI00263A36EB|nr:phosphonate C-P lyase system protein PhnG [uncultured Tateyamaria sp.]